LIPQLSSSAYKREERRGEERRGEERRREESEKERERREKKRHAWSHQDLPLSAALSQ
jgi:hypothetical protein